MVRAGAPEDVAHATISAMRLYDTGVVLPAAGGVMTPAVKSPLHGRVKYEQREVIMALPLDFPESPYAIIDPGVRYLPDQAVLPEMAHGMLVPPLVHKVREQVKTWRDSNYSGASETSKALLNWWFKTEHLHEQDDETRAEFRYYFAQREALEAIIYLSDVVKVK